MLENISSLSQHGVLVPEHCPKCNGCAINISSSTSQHVQSV